MSVYDTDQWRAFIAAIRANPAKPRTSRQAPTPPGSRSG